LDRIIQNQDRSKNLEILDDLCELLLEDRCVPSAA